MDPVVDPTWDPARDPARDPAAVRLAAGPLEARFLPGFGMLCASLRRDGVELLRRIEDLGTAAAAGSTAGVPLLHPWANRLAGPGYRAAGRTVALDPASPLLHLDGGGLPIHGVPWGKLAWRVERTTPDRVEASLAWEDPARLAVFPWRHRLELDAQLAPGALRIETRLVAGRDGPVPVAFGFHPYLGLPGLPRERWRLSLPPMRRLQLDGQGIPTGAEQGFPGFEGEIGAATFDDGFALEGAPASLAISGGGLSLAVELLEGYPFAQVFVPPGKPFVALEPMTAPTNGLASGRGLALAAAGTVYRAVFRIAVAAAA